MGRGIQYQQRDTEATLKATVSDSGFYDSDVDNEYDS